MKKKLEKNRKRLVTISAEVHLRKGANLRKTGLKNDVKEHLRDCFSLEEPTKISVDVEVQEED